MLDFVVYSATTIALWSVIGLSLNLQFGLTGLVNFGQVLPFAIGAYGAGFAAVHGMPWWSGAIGGIVLAPLIGLLAVAWLILHRIAEGPLGRLLRVIREDETLAATLGRNPLRFQMLVTVVAWTLAGAAGVLYAHVTGYVSPASFMVIETFVIWTAVVLGGPGSNLGVVAGTVLVQLTSVSTRFVAQWSHLPSDLVANLRLAAFGLVLVLVFLYRPQGLLPERKKAYDVDRR